MSRDAEEALCDKLQDNSFSIRAHGSTDFTNKSCIVVFVRPANDREIHENLFCCKELSEISKGQDIFNVLASYLEENYVSICTGAAPSVVGSIREYACLGKRRKKILTFHHTNQLDKSLQGPRENVVTSSDKILGFKRKVNLQKNHVVKGNLEMFPQLLGLEREGLESD
jgi:hypothetical protein